MPETCSAVSVRQSNKILRLIVASSWVFYLRHITYWTDVDQQRMNCVNRRTWPAWNLFIEYLWRK